MRDVQWGVTVFDQNIEKGNLANKIHELTIDYGKFIVWCAKRLGVGIGTTAHKSFEWKGGEFNPGT